MNTINWLYLSDCFGVVVFAISGALAAGRRSMDIFGVLVIGFITALGGGTLRDLLLGIHPISWIGNPTYLFLVTCAVIATMLGGRIAIVLMSVYLLFQTHLVWQCLLSSVFKSLYSKPLSRHLSPSLWAFSPVLAVVLSATLFATMFPPSLNVKFMPRRAHRAALVIACSTHLALIP